MALRYPHHAALFSLLQKHQFEACRATIEEMVAHLMGKRATTDVPPMVSGPEAVQELNNQERELACLYNIWCLALFNLHQFRCAAEKADLAGFLAQRIGAVEIFGEARYRAGVCYSSTGEYPLAIQRLTECLDSGVVEFRGDALYNRGFAHQALATADQAVLDYQAAVEWGTGRKPDLVNRCRVNLAWLQILNRDFERAEATLSDLASAVGADDQLYRLHIAHDKAHLLHMKGKKVEALCQAVITLHECGQEFADIRADIVMTIMEIAAENSMSQEAFTLGLLAKRLAGKGCRFDQDEYASRRMQELERRQGTDGLLSSLQKLNQVLQCAKGQRKSLQLPTS